ncbi:MAG: TylF/MycF/NovP-related O-methyltransferase [Candidatus Electrothrix sp. Rat3]|nr:TylF/MycF/NovP-related O-methyltransferase [Candidatus Electrothrix rattekaaiensis]
MNLIKELFRKILLQSPIKHYAFYRYEYNFTPSQLSYLLNCLNATKDIKGNCVEIGCAYGNTTVFLNKHMEYSGINKPYICIDTFTGFTDKDIAYEVQNRDKTNDMFSTAFLYNSKKRFDQTMAFNKVTMVTSYQADIKDFDLSRLGEISFCLFDVDLYHPTITALPQLYQQLSPGGILIIDDCIPDNRFDGAYQAYEEFCATNNFTSEIVEEKLGVIRKISETQGK